MGRILKNPRHERFVKTYLMQMAYGGSATAAYRVVYQGSKGYNCANASAWKLLNKPHIKRRIREMRMDIKRKADITFEKILTDYQDALEMARADNDPGNIIAAAKEQAKLVGLLIDRKEVGSAGDFENMENISDILAAIEREAGKTVADALAGTFKLLPAPEAQKAPESNVDTEALEQAEPASDAVN
jgi:hypothetical protein